MPLSRDAVVVRGGLNVNLEAMLELVLDSVADGLGPVLSVFAAEVAPGENPDDTVARICLECMPGGLRHGKVRRTTVADLTAVGVTLVADPSDDQGAFHFHATMPDVSLWGVEAFVGAFRPPEANPAKEVRDEP